MLMFSDKINWLDHLVNIVLHVVVSIYIQNILNPQNELSYIYAFFHMVCNFYWNKQHVSIKETRKFIHCKHSLKSITF